MSPEVLLMSQKAWASLSSEDRKIFREAAMRSSQFMREKWKDLEDQSRAGENGWRSNRDRLRPQTFAAMAAIYAKAQRDSAAAELIQRIRQVE